MPKQEGEPASLEMQGAGSLMLFDQRLVDSLSVAIYTCDAQGRIMRYNKAAAALWGREPVLGVDLWCGSARMYRLDGSAIALDDCPLAMALKQGHPVRGFDIILERPDGTRRQVRPHPNPILDPAGNIIGAANLLIEVDPGTAGQSIISQEAERTAIESALKARDDFFAILSHELRTPLTPALIALEGMEGDPMLPESLRRTISMVRRNVELEAQIIDDLLDLGRLSQGELKLRMEAVVLNDGLRDVCDICRPQVLEKKLRFEVRLDAGAGRVMADSTRLQHVMWTLLRGAIKCTPAGGTVGVRTFRLGSDAGFEITDSGPAIPPDMEHRLLDPFASGSPALDREFGDRLSLALARSLIQLQLGSLRAEKSPATGGVAFTVELPAASKPAALAPDAGSDRAARKRLLLVEDHPDTATALARYLIHAGFEVRATSGLAESLQLMEEEAFDLVISDIGLGASSGCDLMREIQHRWTIPGIAISGYGSLRDIQRSRDAGFSEHLVKPLKPTHLLETITRVLASGKTPPALTGAPGRT